MADNNSALHFQDNVIEQKEINIMIVAGEVSGDQHGAELIKALSAGGNNFRFFGIGGDEMIKAGLDHLYHIKDIAFMGFAEVVKHIPFMMRVRNELIALTEKKNIEYIIYIDYPGFNLNLAKKLKEAGKKNIYYIAPQIWAWGQKRAFKIKNIIDKLLVINPFEVDFYRQYGIEAVYTGHPLVSKMAEYKRKSRKELDELLNLDPAKEILLLMPGSRKQEIEKIFHPAAEGAIKLCRGFNLQCVVMAAPSVNISLLKDAADRYGFRVTNNYSYDLMNISKLGIIKSGTSTLEAAISGLPHIVVYKTTKLTYEISRRLIKIKNIALANIINGKTVVPELIQDECTPEKIYEAASKLISSPALYSGTRDELLNVRKVLGEKNSAETAAKEIIRFVKGYE